MLPSLAKTNDTAISIMFIDELKLFKKAVINAALIIQSFPSCSSLYRNSLHKSYTYTLQEDTPLVETVQAGLNMMYTRLNTGFSGDMEKWDR